MKALAIAMTFTLGLSACGGSNEVESLETLGELLSEQGIDCSELETTSEELLVREGGDCAGDVNAYVFNSSSNRDDWLEIALEFGGGPYVVGENWVVEVTDQQEAEKLAEDLDAEIR